MIYYARGNGSHYVFFKELHKPIENIHGYERDKRARNRAALAYLRYGAAGYERGYNRRNAAECGQHQYKPHAAAFFAHKLPKAHKRTAHILGLYYHKALAGAGDAAQVGRRRRCSVSCHRLHPLSEKRIFRGKAGKCASAHRACQGRA